MDWSQALLALDPVWVLPADASQHVSVAGLVTNREPSPLVTAEVVAIAPNIDNGNVLALTEDPLQATIVVQTYKLEFVGFAVRSTLTWSTDVVPAFTIPLSVFGTCGTTSAICFRQNTAIWGHVKDHFGTRRATTSVLSEAHRFVGDGFEDSLLRSSRAPTRVRSLVADVLRVIENPESSSFRKWKLLLRVLRRRGAATTCLHSLVYDCGLTQVRHASLTRFLVLDKL